jgi:hypothetical protein
MTGNLNQMDNFKNEHKSPCKAKENEGIIEEEC